MTVSAPTLDTAEVTLTSARLRQAARDLLSGAVTVSGAEPVWAVACIYLMRAALEAELDALWARTLPEVAAAPRRAQLLVLPQVIDTTTARTVAELWGSLSEATHQRGFSIPPTLAECTDWRRRLNTAFGGLRTAERPRR